MYGVKLPILTFKDINLCIHDEARSQNVHQLGEILLKHPKPVSRSGKRKLEKRKVLEMVKEQCFHFEHHFMTVSVDGRHAW